MPDPEGSNLVLLMLMGGIEAVAFGLGVCFLVYGMPWVRRITTGAGTSAPLLYVSVAWLLVNWVPHTALHMMVGNITKPSDFTGLVAIEYGFHLTLILAGACIMYCLMRFNRGATPTATGASAKPRAA